MYRSNEIIEIFKIINIPIDITKYILHMEKIDNLKKSMNEWYLIKIEALSYQQKQFFGDINRSFMLHDIKSINGNFKELKIYRNTFLRNKIQNKLDCAIIMSFRF